MLRYLENLKPGTRFRLAEMPEVTGELIRCNECSATVRVDGGVRDVEFENDDGSVRRFRARRVTTTTWAPATLVEPITTPAAAPAPAPTEETDMATKKKTSKKSTKAAASTKAKKPRAAKEPKDKKLSALDAAAQVLAGRKEPMTAQEMIEAMARAGLWKSPGGKTPHATLYAAIIREISAKGKEARFVKADRGKFARAT